MFHAHWYSAGRDCDGRTSAGGVFRVHDQVEWENDLELVYLLLPWVWQHPDVNEATITTSFNPGGDLEFYAYRDTEEGYDSVHAHLCEHKCDLTEPVSRRDHTAEAAGY